MNASVTFRSILYLPLSRRSFSVGGHLSRRSFSVGGSILALLASAGTALAQGALTPPGPPGPTMKTLEQVEPRVPISSLPFTITGGGSYYFTQDLEFTAASGTAITVNGSNVTIDLMGHTLSSTAAVTGVAISINGNGCTVKNGSITGTTTVVISGSGASRTWTVTEGGFQNGVSSFSSGNGHRFLDLTVAKCRGGGISMTQDNNVLTRCVAYQNGGVGLSGGVATECSAFQNGGYGISVGQNLGAVVTASRAYDNKGVGIHANMAAHSMSQSNGDAGFNVIKVTDCITSFNGGHGVENASSVTGCTARGNLGDGIRGLFVKENQCSLNGGAGIRFGGDGARIEGNNCYNNAFGIQGIASTDSFIVRNSCKGNSGTPVNGGATGDYDFPTSNTFGPIITVSGDMSANPATSHPWANFRY